MFCSTSAAVSIRSGVGTSSAGTTAFGFSVMTHTAQYGASISIAATGAEWWLATMRATLWWQKTGASADMH